MVSVFLALYDSTFKPKSCENDNSKTNKLQTILNCFKFNIFIISILPNKQNIYIPTSCFFFNFNSIKNIIIIVRKCNNY